MKANISGKTSLILLLIIFLTACIEENPNLVNPPPQTATVGLRFYNLASDEKTRILDLGRELQTDEIPFGVMSKSLQPPKDSTYLYVMLNGNEEFRKDRKIRYVPNTNYTVIALPSADGSSDYKPMDSLVVLFSSLGFKSNNPKALLKVFNAYPDSSVTYTAALGCPSGTKLVTGLKYRSQSLPEEVRSGILPVSVTKDSAGEKESHLYNLPLDAGMQYCLMIIRNQQGNDEILLYNEMTEETDPLIKVDSVTEKFTEIRPISFSRNLDPLNVTIQHGEEDVEIIKENMPNLYVGEYTEVGACLTTSLDEVISSIGPQKKSSADVSLEVMERYTYLILDTADTEEGRAALSMILEPLFFDNPLGDDCAIRVVHGAEKLDGLTLSIGARDNDTASIGYSAGDKLASGLLYSEVETTIIPAGVAPLTLFTSSQPAELLFSTLTEFEPGENYLIVITNDAQGNPRMSIINENDENVPVEYMEEGAFIQAVHFVPGLDKIDFRLEPNLTDATIYYTGSIASVVDIKQQTLYLNDNTLNFTPDLDNRTLVVAAGTKDEMDIFHFNESPLSTSSDFYQRRFVNACKEVPEISVKVNSDTTDFYALENLDYGSISPKDQIHLEKKVSLFFLDSRTDTTLLRVDDLPLIFGKKYIIIFGGSLDEGGYTAVVQQEM